MTVKANDNKNSAAKEKPLPLRRRLSNLGFAVRIIFRAVPAFLPVGLLVCVLSQVAGFFADSYLLKKILDSLEAGKSLQSIITYIVIVGISCILISLVSDYITWVWTPQACRLITASVQRPLLKKALSCELVCYERPAFYDHYVRAMEYADSRVQQVRQDIFGLVSFSTSLLADLILLLTIDPLLLLFAFFPLVLGFLQKRIHALNYAHDVAEKPLQRRRSYVQRTFFYRDYAKEYRLSSIHLCMLRDFADTYKTFKELAKKYRIPTTILYFIKSFGLQILAVLGAMAYSVYRALGVGAAAGGMTVGDCIVVLNSISVVSYSINSLVYNFQRLEDNSRYLEDVRTFMDYEPQMGSSCAGLLPQPAEIVFDDVSFRYEGAERDALSHVHFSLRPGERVALVGRNGSGKTTLTKLLLRLYEPTEGQITLDGRPLSDYRLDDYRALFSTVFQDARLFAMTVRENILLRDPQEGDEALVERALRAAGIYDKVASLPKGMETDVTREFSSEGVNFSGGELQKLALARAYASAAPFMVLDEPSSALDPVAEYRMFETVRTVTEGKGVLFISHRLSSAVLADRIYLLDGGQVVETGTHAELMARGGLYAEMFRCQAKNYVREEAGV